MATTDWTGDAADGDWGNNGNWSGDKPATGDTARFLDGALSVTTGLDQSAVNLANLIIGPGYSGNIGLSGSYLKIGCDDLYINGGGILYIEPGTAAIDEVRVLATEQTTGLTLKSSVQTALWVWAGIVNYVFDTAADDLDLYVLGSAADVTITDSAAGDLNTLLVEAGAVELDMDASDFPATVDVRGGTLTVTSAANSPTTVNVWGGSVVWNKAAAASAFNVHSGGTLDFSQEETAKTPTTVTLYGTGILKLNNGCRNIIPGNIYVYGDAAPTPIHLDKGMYVDVIAAA